MDSMEPHVEQATRALFEGNRTEVLRLLRGQARTGQEHWLVACALEDGEERLKALRRVEAIGHQPYASLARDILLREAQSALEIRKPPKWQTWIRERLDYIIAVLIVLMVIIGLMLIFVL
jgi:hypothetical protein